VKRLPRRDASTQGRRGRAGERDAQAKNLHFQRHILRGARFRRQVLRMIKDEPQRDRFVVRPDQWFSERSHLPGRNGDQIAVPGAQGIGGCAAPVEVCERRLVGFAELGTAKQDEMLLWQER